MACAPSTVLPRNPDTRGEAAKRGDLIHAVIAAELRGWEQPDRGRYRLAIDMDGLRTYLGEGKLMCELAMAYGDGQVELLGENVGRSAYPDDGRLCGSADIVVLNGEEATVFDTKTGALPVPSPRENWQVATLGMFVARLFGQVKRVRGAIGKLGRDGAWDFSEHVFDLEQLARVQSKIDAARGLWRTVDEVYASGWGVDTTPGPHCRYCRVKAEHCQYAEATTYPAAAVANAV